VYCKPPRPVGHVTACRTYPPEVWSFPPVTPCILHYNPQHVSSSTLLIFRRTNCIITASGIVTLCKQPYSMPFESGLQTAMITQLHIAFFSSLRTWWWSKKDQNMLSLWTCKDTCKQVLIRNWVCLIVTPIKKNNTSVFRYLTKMIVTFEWGKYLFHEGLKVVSLWCALFSCYKFKEKTFCISLHISLHTSLGV